MIIREATLTDVPQLVEMGRAFRQSIYAASVSENVTQMEQTARDLIERLGVVFVAEGRSGALVGMIGLVLSVHFLTGLMTASEAFWWVDAPYRGSLGVRLFHWAKRWAREQGATKLQMIQPIAETRVGDFYQAQGLVCVESCWELDLTSKEAAA